MRISHPNNPWMLKYGNSWIFQHFNNNNRILSSRLCVYTPAHYIKTTNMTIQDKSKQSKWSFLIYSILTLYYFGSIIFTYFSDYPTFGNVHEHFQTFMNLTIRIREIGFIPPAVLMLFSTFSLLRYNQTDFPRWTIIASIGLAVVSVSTSLFVVFPIYLDMGSLGFNVENQHKLLSSSMNFQIIPAIIQCLILVGLMNVYFKETSPTRRWLFIVIFFITFYTLGFAMFDTTEVPIWLSVGEKDWMAYRHSGTLGFGGFAAIYLLPGVLPMFLMIPLFWLRPPNIPLYLPVIRFILSMIILFVSATYFAPKIQFELDKGYSRTLIDDYWLRQFGRYSLAVITYILTALMFLKIDSNRITQ